MGVAWTAVERAMRMQEVILRALSGAISWLQAADILGIDPRSLRRWRARYEADRLYGLFDRRHRPSWRRAPLSELERIVRLYREQYAGFNVRHFHQLARRDHGVTYSYSFVKLALQEASLVRKGRSRGRHRRRREPRPCFGELLHLDGSRHAWLGLCLDDRQTLIAVLDDATKRLLYAQLWPGETAAAVMTALREVFETFGLPIALYTDRARWAFYPPKAGGKVDPRHLTQLGRALAQLGIEHIASYSPQGRGRSERLNRTVQGRLINELALAGIRTVDAANAYLRDRFMADYNEEFAQAPADPTSAFVPLPGAELDAILCHVEERTVGRDNVVVLDEIVLQVPKQPGRRSCAGLGVTVRRDLHGEHSIWHGTQCWGRFDAAGRPLAARAAARQPRPENARAQLAQDRRSSRPPRVAIPPTPPKIKLRHGPRLPVGPAA
jgi:Helix-turn-helix domain